MKGPGPERVAPSPAALTAATRVLNEPAPTAVSTMLAICMPAYDATNISTCFDYPSNNRDTWGAYLPRDDSRDGHEGGGHRGKGENNDDLGEHVELKVKRG